MPLLSSFLSLGMLLAIEDSLSSSSAAESGTVAAWGYRGTGQLDFPSGLTNVSAVSLGSAHGLALTDKHTVIAWGNNSFPFLTNIPPNLTNVLAVAASSTH